MKNKNGKASPMVWVVMGILVVLLIYLFASGVLQSAVGGNGAGSTETGCQGDTPTLSLAVSDALDPSTAVSTGLSAKINGGANQTITSSTDLGKNSNVEVLATASGYQATIFGPYTIGCGSNQKSGTMKAISSPTVAIITVPGGDTATNVSTAIATTNITKASAGGSLKFGIELTGTDKKTTGDMVVLIETNSSVDTLTLDGVVGSTQKTPETYTDRVSTNSKVFYFELSAFDNAQDEVHNAIATMKSGESYAVVPLYVSVLGKNNFLDSTGNYAYGIETSDGQTSESAYDTLAVAWIE